MLKLEVEERERQIVKNSGIANSANEKQAQIRSIGKKTASMD